MMAANIKWAIAQARYSRLIIHRSERSIRLRDGSPPHRISLARTMAAGKPAKSCPLHGRNKYSIASSGATSLTSAFLLDARVEGAIGRYGGGIGHRHGEVPSPANPFCRRAAPTIRHIDVRAATVPSTASIQLIIRRRYQRHNSAA